MPRYWKLVNQEPYRLFFPLGVLALLWGALVWLPLIWESGAYPVLLHRYLMLNGFAGCFIGGFLMTAVPKFSQTAHARPFEIFLLLASTLLGLVPAIGDHTSAVFLFSSIQPLVLLAFLFARISKRKENPPYSFIFIFVGLFLWFASGLLGAIVDAEAFKHLHYEGAIASIILGVGSRLIPGILGHVDVVSAQRKQYEQVKPLLRTVPPHFFVLIAAFVGSYFLAGPWGPIVRALVVGAIGFLYWRLSALPKDKTALTWSIWSAGWLILLSFILKAVWVDGLIHVSHAFFINGVVLLGLLVATRVLQSHGPKDKQLEGSRVLYATTFLILVASATRVCAFLMPERYLTHLAYSALILTGAVLLWSWKYLRFVGTSGAPNPGAR